VGIHAVGGRHHLRFAFATEAADGFAQGDIRRALPALLGQRVKRRSGCGRSVPSAPTSGRDARRCRGCPPDPVSGLIALRQSGRRWRFAPASCSPA
jgi:hypothetical protein